MAAAAGAAALWADVKNIKFRLQRDLLVDWDWSAAGAQEHQLSDIVLQEMASAIQNTSIPITNTSLRSLSIAGWPASVSSVSETGICSLFDALLSCAGPPKPEEVEVEAHEGEDGKDQVYGGVSLIPLFVNMREVSLDQTAAGDKTCSRLKKLILHWPNLQKLSLMGCALISSRGAAELSSSLGSTNLQKLDLYGASLGDDGVRIIVESLPQSLKHLDLYSVGLSSAGVISLCSILSAVGAPAIETLNLKSNNCEEEGARAVANFLGLNNSLLELNLENSNLQLEGIRALHAVLCDSESKDNQPNFEMPRKNRRLRKLVLFRNNDGEDGAVLREEISQSLKRVMLSNTNDIRAESVRLVPMKRLKVIRQLGSGAFGMTYLVALQDGIRRAAAAAAHHSESMEQMTGSSSAKCTYLVVKVPKQAAEQDLLNEFQAFCMLPPHQNVMAVSAICPDFEVPKEETLAIVDYSSFDYDSMYDAPEEGKSNSVNVEHHNDQGDGGGGEDQASDVGSKPELLGDAASGSCSIDSKASHGSSRLQFGLVMVYCPRGDLRNALIRGALSLDSQSMVKMLQDIARGLQHLHVNGIVHRDLAARNILLDAQSNALISDFGLSLGLVEGQDHRAVAGEKLPLLWCAPETLRSGTFSTKSDVWSFGVFIFEVCTLCRILPFSDFRPISAEFLEKDGRETLSSVIAEFCSTDNVEAPPLCVSRAMNACLSPDPSDRPDMSDVISLLQ